MTANKQSQSQRKQPVNGFVLLDKPIGLSSTQAMAKVRTLFKGQKAGHGGTLDPFASGLLLVALGEGTKALPFILASDKEYEFTLRFGTETDSQDSTGLVVASTDIIPDGAAIEAAMVAFIGETLQTPPAFSAIKINGVPSYKRARALQNASAKNESARFASASSQAELTSAQSTSPSAESTSTPAESISAPATPTSTPAESISAPATPTSTPAESISTPATPTSTPTQPIPSTPPLAARKIRIDEFTLTAQLNERDFTLRVRGQSGLYVRTLGHDLAKKLGSLGHVVQLRRLAVGNFCLDDAFSLAKLEEIDYSDRTNTALLDFCDKRLFSENNLVKNLPRFMGLETIFLNETDSIALRLGKKIILSKAENKNLDIILAIDPTHLPIGFVSYANGVLMPKRIFIL